MTSVDYFFGKGYVSLVYDGLVYVYNMTKDRTLTLVQKIGTVVEQTEQGGCCQATLSRNPGVVLFVKTRNNVVLSTNVLLYR